MYGRYSMFDLMEPGSDEKLRNILKKLDIDYTPQMQDSMSGKPSKENVLSNVLNILPTSKKIIEFKKLLDSSFATDQEFIKAQNIEVNFEKIKIFNLISKRIILKLEEEIKNIFLEMEKIKNAQEEIKELNRKDALEKDERIKQAIAADLMLAQGRLNELMARIDKDKMIEEAKNKIQELNRQIKDIDNQLAILKENKNHKLQEFYQESAIEYRDFKHNGIDIFKDLSNEELIKFAEAREKIRNQNTKPIRMLDEEREDIKNQIGEHEQAIAKQKHEISKVDKTPQKSGGPIVFTPARQFEKLWAKDPIIIAKQEEIRKLRDRVEQLVDKRKELVVQVSAQNQTVNVKALEQLGHTELAKLFKEDLKLSKAFDEYNSKRDEKITQYREEYREEKKELKDQRTNCTDKIVKIEAFDFDVDSLLKDKTDEKSQSKIRNK